MPSTPTTTSSEIEDEDFDDVWTTFLEVRRFYRSAAEKNRAVIFTVDA